MKRILFCVSVIVVLALVIVPRRSEALGSESLGCRVSSGQFHAGHCVASLPRLSYAVGFKVLNGAGAYTYEWNTNGLPVSSGCTSTSDFCDIAASGITDDQTLSVSVTITQAGQSATLPATAFIPAVCGDYDGSPVWC